RRRPSTQLQPVPSVPNASPANAQTGNAVRNSGRFQSCVPLSETRAGRESFKPSNELAGCSGFGTINAFHEVETIALGRNGLKRGQAGEAADATLFAAARNRGGARNAPGLNAFKLFAKSEFVQRANLITTNFDYAVSVFLTCRKVVAVVGQKP